MNNGTYEGILNQDDTQEYLNGDDARPFYPERAEITVFRARTHYDGCHRVHPECAFIKIQDLETEIEHLRAALDAANADALALAQLISSAQFSQWNARDDATLAICKKHLEADERQAQETRP